MAEAGLAPSKSARRRKAAARKGLGGGQKGKAGPALKRPAPQGGAGGKARALIGDDGALRQTPARQRANMLPRYTKRARKTGLPAQIRHMKAGRSEHRLRPKRD